MGVEATKVSGESRTKKLTKESKAGKNKDGAAKDEDMTGNIDMQGKSSKTNKTERIGKEKQRLFWATWNVRSTYEEGALKNLIEEAIKIKASLIALQETRQSGVFIRDIENFTLFNSGGENRRLGTGFLVTHKLKEAVTEFKAISDRLCYLRLTIEARKVSIINCHAPTEEKDGEEKEAFYEEMGNIYDRIPRQDVKIVMGDCNAKVGRERYYQPIIGKYSLHEVSNDNGQRLVDFAAERNLIIRSTQFEHKQIHKGTWRAPGGRYTNQIDHVLIQQRHAGWIKDVRSYRGPDVDSDHFLVGIKLGMAREESTKIKSNKKVIEKWQLEGLIERKVRDKYQTYVKTNIREMQTTIDIEDKCKRIEESIKNAADRLLKTVPTRRRGWFSEECREMLSKRNNARMQALRTEHENDKEIYKQCRKETKKLLRSVKRQHKEKEIIRVEERFKNKEIKNFYQEVKRTKKGFQTAAAMLKSKNGQLIGSKRGQINRWREHFEEALKITVDNVEDEGNIRENTEMRQSVEKEITMEPPTLEEVEKVIEHLKNGKSAGEDEIAAELIKYAGNDMHREIYNLLSCIWETERMPEKWKEAVLIPIYKKGEKCVCDNYRGIALLDVLYKILATLLAARIKAQVEKVIGDYQGGFREARGTVDQIFTVKQELLHCYEYKKEAHLLFIDFKQAYDSVDRKKLYDALFQLGLPGKLVRLVKMTQEDCVSKVRVNGMNSKTFKVEKGIRQGDPLSALLFILLLEKVMRASGLNRNGTIYNKSHQCVAYADDLTLITGSLKTMKSLIKKLEREARKVGLVINEDKTKYMKVGKKTVQEELATEVKFYLEGSRKLKCQKVKSFVYLGALITENSDEKEEIKARLIKGQRSQASLRQLLKSKELSRTAKVRIYRTIIRPTVTYAAETWILNKNQQQCLEGWERKVLRGILGGKKVNGQWQRRTNAEVMELYGQESIVSYIKAQRIRWLGHVKRAEEERAIKRVLRGVWGEARRKGRPRKEWLDSVLQDLKELKVQRWEEAAMDRPKWRTIVHKAMGRAGL